MNQDKVQRTKDKGQKTKDKGQRTKDEGLRRLLKVGQGRVYLEEYVLLIQQRPVYWKRARVAVFSLDAASSKTCGEST